MPRATDGGLAEGGHPVAVLESQFDLEVALQAATDGIAGQGSQQLAAMGLARRRHLVIGEVIVPTVQVISHAG